MFFRLRITAVLALALACGGGEPAPRPAALLSVRDDAGRAIELAHPARRIVSLVPSVTETIVALGAADRLVARTDYDVAPELADLPSVGGGLDPSVEALVRLAPDLVVAWNARDDAGLGARLQAAGIPVYAATIEDTSAAFATIDRMGLLLGLSPAADSVAGALRDTLAAIARETMGRPRPRAFFLLDAPPPRTAGPGTFVSQILSVAGADPAYPEVRGDWPAIALEAVVASPPDVVIIPTGESAGPSLADRPGWRSVPAVSEGRVILVPSNLVSRPGPAMGAAARVFRDSLRALAQRTEAF
jgi:ABC-type Fe3+-hydroxamate transport system substrate-binding protein